MPFAAIAVFAIVLALYRSATLNNFYEFGAGTDPVWFAGMLWHGDLRLSNPRSFNGASYFATHFSPTLIGPALLSWLLPFDHIGWFALLMGAFHALTTAALAFALWAAARALALRRAIAEGLAFAGGMAFGFNGLQAGFMGLPHFEILIPGLMIAMIAALALRRVVLAAILLAALIGTREDGGLHAISLLAPLIVLVWWTERRVLRLELHLALIAFAAAVVIVVLMRKIVPMPENLLRRIYVGEPAFAHLDLATMLVRLEYVAWQCAHIWGPLLAMALAALLRRDLLLAIGAVAPLPWLAAQVLVAIPESAHLLAYYAAFPVLAAMAWPTLLALYRSRPGPLAGSARGLLAVQAVVLALAYLPTFNAEQRLHVSRYWQVEFLPAATAGEAASHRRFGAAIDTGRGELGALGAAIAVIAFAPFAIERTEWLDMQASWERRVPPARLDTLLLFEHRLSCSELERAMFEARMPHHFIVPGTRILVATRRSLAELPSFAALLKPIGVPARLCGRLEPLRG